MNRLNRTLVAVLVFCNLLSGAAFPLNGQQLLPLNADLASKQLDDVRLRGDGAGGLLADLSLWYDIPIGFEMAMNTGGGFASLRMDFRKATLAEVLNQFVAEHPEYEWEISDGVVNVFPKDGWRDPIVNQILSTEIATFSLAERTVTFEVERALLATPELKQLMDGYALTTSGWSFSGFAFPTVGPTFKLDVSNLPVRAILNKVVKESRTARYWSINRDSAEHTISIGFAANHENSPRRMRRADFEDLEETLDLIPWDSPNR